VHFGGGILGQSLGLGRLAPVEFFFILSGFLITSILLQSREKLSFGQALGRFYERRLLRICPIYYLTLFVTAGISLLMPLYGEMRDRFWWHATYLSNVAVVRDADTGYYGHLWSLAVEFQFYLIWPWIVLAGGRRATFVASIVMLGIATAFGFWWTSRGIPFGGFLTPAQLDNLACGALLGLVWQKRDLFLSLLRNPLVKLVAGLAFAGWCWSVASGLVPALGERLFRMTWQTWLIGAAAACPLMYPKFLGWLAHPVLVWLGTISYGGYLYHLFVPHGWETVIRYAGLPRWLLEPWPMALTCVALSIGLAGASWHLLEQPLQRWKNRRLPAPGISRDPGGLRGDTSGTLVEDQTRAKP
jgi:peptidoglycan/LPS O-acetylase OafA/YrhL